MIKRLFVILTCFVLVFPVLAQDLSDEEQAYLDEITSALETTFGAGSYHLEGQQVTEQYLEFAGTEMTQELIQIMDGDFVTFDDNQNVYMVLEQEIFQSLSGTEFELAMTMEMLVNDDGLFLQVSDVEPATFAAVYPDEWILLEDSSADQYPGLAALNAGQMNQLVDAETLVTPLVDMTAIASGIEQLDDEEIDGTTMTVYRVTADPQLLFSDEYMDTMTGLFNFDALGVDASLMSFEVSEDALIQYTFYIGQEDGLLYYQASELELEMTIDGTPMGVPGDFVIDQTVTAEFTLSDFGADIELPSPETDD